MVLESVNYVITVVLSLDIIVENEDNYSMILFALEGLLIVVILVELRSDRHTE